MNETIDSYAKQIETSVKNDDLMWRGSRGRNYRAGTYLTWESDVRYLKWFLTNRINYLCEDMDIERDELIFEVQGVHEVTFITGGEIIAQADVPDGQPIDFAQIPELASYDNTQWRFEYSGECYNTALPVLENCRLVY